MVWHSLFESDECTAYATCCPCVSAVDCSLLLKCQVSRLFAVLLMLNLESLRQRSNRSVEFFLYQHTPRSKQFTSKAHRMVKLEEALESWVTKIWIGVNACSSQPRCQD